MHSENPKQTEFLTTVKAIKMYAATQYKNQFIHMKEYVFKNFQESTISKPSDVPSSANKTEKLIYIEDYKACKNEE